jgi:hypothetical protein
MGHFEVSSIPCGENMTAEERDRLNALCIQIQQEKNYQKFEELTRELHDVDASKERRFPERKSPQRRSGRRGLETDARRR